MYFVSALLVALAYASTTSARCGCGLSGLSSLAPIVTNIPVIADIPITASIPVATSLAMASAVPVTMPCGCAGSCGCGTSFVDVGVFADPIMTSACGFSVVDVPALELSCGCGVPSCGCGITSCGCGVTSCGCGIPSCGCGVTSCGCAVPSCGCASPSCGRVLPTCGCGGAVFTKYGSPALPPLPPMVGACGQYLRKVCVLPPFL